MLSQCKEATDPSVVDSWDIDATVLPQCGEAPDPVCNEALEAVDAEP